jgi:hypothetical protein
MAVRISEPALSVLYEEGMDRTCRISHNSHDNQDIRKGTSLKAAGEDSNFGRE